MAHAPSCARALTRRQAAREAKNQLEAALTKLQSEHQVLHEKFQMVGQLEDQDQADDMHKALNLVRTRRLRGEPTDLEFLLPAFDKDTGPAPRPRPLSLPSAHGLPQGGFGSQDLCGISHTGNGRELSNPRVPPPPPKKNSHPPPPLGCIGGGGGTPPPSRAPSLCPAPVSMTASASFRAIGNRQ